MVLHVCPLHTSNPVGPTDSSPPKGVQFTPRASCLTQAHLAKSWCHKSLPSTCCCQLWGARHPVVHTAEKNLSSVFWSQTPEISSSRVVPCSPSGLPMDKGKHPLLPQEAQVGTGHNGNSVSKVLSLGFSSLDILLRLGVGNSKSWVKHLALTLLA